jgi:hypothetical protein
MVGINKQTNGKDSDLVVRILAWATAVILTLGGGGIMLAPIHQNELIYNIGMWVFAIGCILACIIGLLAISKK